MSGGHFLDFPAASETRPRPGRRETPGGCNGLAGTGPPSASTERARARIQGLRPAPASLAPGAHPVPTLCWLELGLALAAKPTTSSSSFSEE